jgi:pimeloyl-ACP methyl ester carboxylesterase
MRKATIDGVRIAYECRGTGPPLVVLHGGSGRREQGEELASLLEIVTEVAAEPAAVHGLHTERPAPVAELIRDFLGVSAPSPRGTRDRRPAPAGWPCGSRRPAP